MWGWDMFASHGGSRWDEIQHWHCKWLEKEWLTVKKREIKRVRICFMFSAHKACTESIEIPSLFDGQLGHSHLYSTSQNGSSLNPLQVKTRKDAPLWFLKWWYKAPVNSVAYFFLKPGLTLGRLREKATAVVNKMLAACIRVNCCLPIKKRNVQFKPEHSEFWNTKITAINQSFFF